MIIQQYKDKFWAYLNKDNFDHMEGLIDPLVYHSSFITFARLFSVMDYEKLPVWMYISPIATAISAIAAGTIVCISITEYVRQFQIDLLTESGTYLFVMMYKLLLATSVIRGRKQYHKLLQALRDDFHYICTTGQKYRKKFFENQRRTFKTCVVVAIFTGSMGGGMATCACIAIVIEFQRHDAVLIRPLPFPFWLFGYNLHASPTYEILFAVSLMFTFFHTYVNIFTMQSHVIWIGEITCRADIITWNLQDMLVDVIPSKNNEEKEYYVNLIKHRMRSVIEMHHDMFKLADSYAAVFKKCLLYEQIVASPIICLTAYCFAEKYDSGEFKLILLLLCTAATVVAFIPCYLCTILLEKVQSVSDACWDMPFWNVGPVIRPYLVLMMQRSMRPLPITAAGFADISLQTFSSMMARAYSCFNMLRQADFNIS